MEMRGLSYFSGHFYLPLPNKDLRKKTLFNEKHPLTERGRRFKTTENLIAASAVHRLETAKHVLDFGSVLQIRTKLKGKKDAF